MQQTIHKLSKNIAGHEYTLHGANADIASWMARSALAERALSPSRISVDDIYRAFDAGTEPERVTQSKKIVERLWHARPALGPYPFLDTFAEFQFDRMFYPNYRDHVCHQLKVYLLGLFVYDQCPVIQNEFARSIKSTGREPIDEFLTQWLVTALYHDIGYVLENDQALHSGGTTWEKTRDALNKVLDAPLSTLPQFSNVITSDVEHRLIQNHHIFTPKVLAIADIEKYNKISLLDQLRDEAKMALLGIGDSPFHDYYHYALTHDVYSKVPDATGSNPIRGRFRDHGIVSALLLLRTWRAFNDYVTQFIAKAGTDPMVRPHFAKLDLLAKDLALHAESIRSAAAAMALHNICGSWWEPNEALAHNLTFHSYKICLTEEGHQLPLSFLLGMVDSLQDWDRPRYRADKDSDKLVLLDKDISITAQGGKLCLFLPRDLEKYKDPASNHQSQFSKAKKAMKEYLEDQAIDNLIEWTEHPSAPILVPPATSPSAVESTTSFSASSLLPSLDRLPQSFQSYGKANLFITGTSLVQSAKKRVVLVAKTPIIVVGSRPYDSDAEPPYYEREQYDAYQEIIKRASSGREIDFVCIGSIPALLNDVSSLSNDLKTQFIARIQHNLNHIQEAANLEGSRCVQRWTEDPFPMTYLVADDDFILWFKDDRGESVCLTAESALIADALVHQSLGRGIVIDTEELTSRITS